MFVLRGYDEDLNFTFAVVASNNKIKPVNSQIHNRGDGGKLEEMQAQLLDVKVSLLLIDEIDDCINLLMFAGGL